MHPLLSARQEQCLRLTAFRTDKEIAAHLGISEATVKKHVHEACHRLGVNRRKAALALLDPIVPDAGPSAPSRRAAGYTKQPIVIAGSPAHALADDPVVENEGEQTGRADLVRQHAARPLDEQVSSGGIEEDELSGPQTDAQRRLGYRTPPSNPALRVVLIVALTIVLAALIVTLVVMLGDMHEAVGKIDAASKAR